MSFSVFLTFKMSFGLLLLDADHTNFTKSLLKLDSNTYKSLKVLFQSIRYLKTTNPTIWNNHFYTMHKKRQKINYNFFIWITSDKIWSRLVFFLGIWKWTKIFLLYALNGQMWFMCIMMREKFVIKDSWGCWFKTRIFEVYTMICLTRSILK